MNVHQFRHSLWKVVFNAGVNQRYHQRTAGLRGALDKLVKISVGLLALAALVAAILGEPARAWDIGFAAAAAAAAVTLNVLPVSESAAFSQEMFRAWTDLRICAQVLYGKSERVRPERSCALRLDRTARRNAPRRSSSSTGKSRTRTGAGCWRVTTATKKASSATVKLAPLPLRRRRRRRRYRSLRLIRPWRHVRSLVRKFRPRAWRRRWRWPTWFLWHLSFLAKGWIKGRRR